MPYDKQLIELLLINLRAAIDDRDCTILLKGKTRYKNAETLMALAMKPRDAWDEMYSLKVDDYVKGPEEDRDFPGTYFWFFNKVIKNKLIYIKFKLLEGMSPKLKVVSFHFDKNCKL